MARAEAVEVGEGVPSSGAVVGEKGELVGDKVDVVGAEVGLADGVFCTSGAVIVY